MQRATIINRGCKSKLDNQSEILSWWCRQAYLKKFQIYLPHAHINTKNSACVLVRTSDSAELAPCVKVHAKVTCPCACTVLCCNVNECEVCSDLFGKANQNHQDWILDSLSCADLRPVSLLFCQGIFPCAHHIPCSVFGGKNTANPVLSQD